MIKFVLTSLLLLFTAKLFASPSIVLNNNLKIELGNASLKPFYRGFYGKIDSATIFIAHKKDVPDRTKIYWAIVQVLSKKYGCFMTKRASRGPYHSFLCKDSRTVIFHSHISNNYIVFSGRQYDDKGREIIINNKKVTWRQANFDSAYPTQNLPQS